MKVDAAATLETGGRWDGDMDGTIERAQKPPEDGGGAVAQYGALAAGENGGHETAVEAKAAVAHRVNALVDAVESTRGSPFRDRRTPQPRLRQLPRGHNSMLRSRETGDRVIAGVAFVRHIRTKATRPSTSPPTSPLFAFAWGR
jgi:hypothetical protein